MSKTKYLWAAVLVALCVVSLGSGAARAAAPLTDAWDLLNQSFPDTIVWDESAPASLQIENTGTSSWDATYGMVSVQGITVSAFPIDRWGLTVLPVNVPTGTPILPLQSVLFNFDIVGPAATSLKYDQPVTPTSPGTLDEFDCNFILAHPFSPTVGLITTDTAENPIEVGRFPDTATGTDGGWARFWVEELTGRVPEVVLGFPDGTYRPLVEVTRDQMAAYIRRAMKIPTEAFEGMFTDIPTEISNVFSLDIEALARAKVVLGFSDDTYRPSVVVQRDSMAAYITRGIVGGDEFVPTGPARATFPDVPTDYWAFKYIEFAVADGVVLGFPDGSYGPIGNVTRDQMAVFIWRAFVRPSEPGSVVVLAGPLVTPVQDPDTSGYIGWTSTEFGPQGNPGFAVVAFDGVRLSSTLAFPATPTGSWNVTFELRPGTSPSAAAKKTFSFSPAELEEIKEAAIESGDPYLVLAWQIPNGLSKGAYALVVKASDEAGEMFEAVRQPGFAIQ